jgi:hypothetical protein
MHDSSLGQSQLALDLPEHNFCAEQGLSVNSAGRWDDGEWPGKDVVVAKFKIFPIFAWNI